MSCKYLFDYFLAFLLLILIGWLIPILVLIMSFNLGSFGWFSQERVGKDGRIFRIYKIKTMCPTASYALNAQEDISISHIARMLRKYHLDELPQLINVLKGDMSFVGPRPDIRGFADQLTKEDRIILSVKPGITGPASLRFKNEERLLALQEDPDQYNRQVIWPEKVRINKRYVRHRTFCKDLYYLCATIF